MNLNKGENITTAVTVLRETYKNLALFFSEFDRIAEEEDFTVLTPRFLRWKSDSDYDGWLTANFIKLYKNNDPTLSESEKQMVYGIEVDLAESDDSFPTLSITKFTFGDAAWTERLSIADHWIFYNPFRMENLFTITYENETWKSETQPKALTRYMNMQCAIAKSFPLVSIHSPESIRETIFPALKTL